MNPPRGHVNPLRGHVNLSRGHVNPPRGHVNPLRGRFAGPQKGKAQQVGASTSRVYTRSPLQDSRLFGPSPWKILAATYEQIDF